MRKPKWKPMTAAALGLLVLVAGCSGPQDRTAALENEVAALRQTVAALQVRVDQQQTTDELTAGVLKRQQEFNATTMEIDRFTLGD